MSSSASEALIGAVIAFGRGLPVEDKLVRRPVANALGLKRLRAARFEAVLNEALSTERILLVEDKLYPQQETKKLVPDKPKTERPVKSKSPPPPNPPNKKYMGLMLEARLNTQSQELPKGSRASATFCHCPHCGQPLLLEGAIKVVE